MHVVGNGNQVCNIPAIHGNDVVVAPNRIVEPQETFDPELDPTYKEVFVGNCDICWFLGSLEKQRVKWIHGLVMCKPCCMSYEEIERE